MSNMKSIKRLFSGKCNFISRKIYRGIKTKKQISNLNAEHLGIKLCARITVFFFFIILAAVCLPALDFLEEGKKMLAQDMPDKAVPLLYQASAQAEHSAEVFLYLGTAYLRIGKYADAIIWLEKGKKKDIINNHLYCYNIGIALFAQNRMEEAEKAFSEALDTGILYTPAILNRANTRVKSGKYAEALEDYKNYLNLEPESSRRKEIIKMIAVLEQTEKEKAEAKILAEAEKLAEEARRAAEEERQKKLLEEVNASLSSVDEADSLSSGAENTIDYTEENDLD